MQNNTNSEDYFNEIYRNTQSILRKVIPTQLPYSYNLRRLKLGRVLEVGCGLGRNLKALDHGSIGIDHNLLSIDFCKGRGLEVYETNEFLKLATGNNDFLFDTLLMSHVLEHIEFENQIPVLSQYLAFLKPNSSILLITPQEAGHKSTDSHITWTDFNRLCEILQSAAPDWKIEKSFSFPFPRVTGPFFTFNEFNLLAKRSANLV
jgi:2-polyprenyl-3-methyl-5-hydroxy-6-metoxy-1,4-benzoquinol methylase